MSTCTCDFGEGRVRITRRFDHEGRGDAVRTLRLVLPALVMLHIMVCATHTHSGPEVFTRSKLPPRSGAAVSDPAQSYRQVLVRKMADCVPMAHQNMRDVRIGAALGEVPEVLFNRRPGSRGR